MKGKLLFFTGLPCSGKTTIAKYLYPILKRKGIKVVHLDGDVVRAQLWNDLGFSKKDRRKNLERVTNLSKMFINNDVWVLATFVAPYMEVREWIEETIGEENYIEIYVKASPGECARRDVKGMWKSAKEGKIKGFTGYDAPYEEPWNSNIIIYTEKESVKNSVDKILDILTRKGLIK